MQKSRNIIYLSYIEFACLRQALNQKLISPIPHLYSNESDATH